LDIHRHQTIETTFGPEYLRHTEAVAVLNLWLGLYLSPHTLRVFEAYTGESWRDQIARKTDILSVSRSLLLPVFVWTFWSCADGWLGKSEQKQGCADGFERAQFRH
jgi:hypothetical protein